LSLLFHVSHLIINWILNVKNSLQLVDLVSIPVYLIMGICTYIPRRNSKFVYNLSSANHFSRRLMYIFGSLNSCNLIILLHVDKIEKQIGRVLRPKWIGFKIGCKFRFGYKFIIGYRAFKANKLFEKYLVNLETLDVSVKRINIVDTTQQRCERSCLLYKIEKNSLQYVDLFSLLSYAIIGICTFITRRNSKFVFNLASAYHFSRRLMYIVGCIKVQGGIMARP
jgi:hypothetical protein